MNSIQQFRFPNFSRNVVAHAGNIFRYAFSRSAWKLLLLNLRNRKIVKKSGLVDEEWYRREYPEVAEKGIDPVKDFMAPPNPWLRMPNPDFVPAEYAAANFDVKSSGMPWIVHYVSHGRREGRPVSLLEDMPKPFPPDAVELRREFAAEPVVHRRTAIFASFSADGHVKETVLYYLRGLREVVDNIVFVSNSPVFKDEVEKLNGLVRIVVFRHHGCYDFGSYKIGWNEAQALGLLEPNICDELVVCNDSCYGPVFPFPEAFAEMARRNREAKPENRFDFWGMTSHRLFGRPHLQSYFYVFGKAVLEEPTLARFFYALEPPRERGKVVYFCETMLSPALVQAGHRFDSLVPMEAFSKREAPPIKFPVSLLSNYRMPLFKAKTLKGESMESLVDAVAIVRKENPELANLLPTPPEKTSFEIRSFDGFARSRESRLGHIAAMDKTASSIRSSGHPVRVLFLSTTADPFPGRELFDQLYGDSAFVAAVAMVPDLRLNPQFECFAALRAAREALSVWLPAPAMIRATTDTAGEWNDLSEGFDVVVYATAENASDFRYNPRWSIGRNFLPVLLFDRRTAAPYPLEKEFARQNYVYFWKVFFTNRKEYDLYVKHSIRKGENAEFIQDESKVASRLSELLKSSSVKTE